jgi:predicted phage terminase large subunit-like protein
MPNNINMLNLDPDQMSRLKALLAEAQSRGILIDGTRLKKRQQWPSDPDGYCVKSDGKRYRPNEHQLEFLTSEARFTAFISGRSAGKTCTGSQKALHKIMQGKSGAVLNPDFANFKISTWPEFREWIPWSMVDPRFTYMRTPSWAPHEPFTMSFRTGATVLCKGLKDPDSARGPNINWLWYDEAGRDRDGTSWLNAIASVRIGDSPQAWITTTPKGKAHWIYRFFVQQDIPEESIKLFEEHSHGKKFVDVFYTNIMDNKDNLDPGFFAAMLASYPPGYLREQEIMGRFVDEGGALGDPRWFDGKIVDKELDAAKGRCRFWDLAATEKKMVGRKSNDPDETVGTKLSWNGKDFYIENQVAGCWEWNTIKEQIKQTAILDGWSVKIFVEQEPASGGKNQVAELKAFIRDKVGGAWQVEGYRPEGDRVQGANIWFAEAAQGRFYMVRGVWNDGFLAQLESFPDSDVHDDKITSVTGARLNLAPVRTWKHIEFLHL